MIPYGQITEFNIGPVTIQAWGLMVALGFIAAILLILWQASRSGYKVDKLIDLSLLIFIASMAGARMMYVILFWENFSGGNWLEMFKVWNGGMVYYGGFIGALIAWFLYARWQKLNFWKLADWGAPALALGLAIGRVGCHLIRDHPGIITTIPWGMEYGGQIRHETAMYSVLANLAIFLILWFWLRRKNMATGSLFAIFLGWYGVTRFIIDFFRASDLPYSDPRFFGGNDWVGLTSAQIISVGLVIFSVWLYVYLKKRNFPGMAGLPPIKKGISK
jgi:phosphatidylglycerol---prolipoprotein diacylglyceryl transferase